MGLRERGCALGFPGVAADLGKEEIDAEGCVLVDEVRLELTDLIPEHVGGVADAAENAHTASVGDGRCQLGAGGDVHTCQQDGVLNSEEIGDRGANSLYAKPLSAVSFVTRRCAALGQQGNATAIAPLWKTGCIRGEAIVTV
jgi:hypothetical protein